jgi:hypothetical protein
MADFESGLSRARSGEKSNQSGGKSGSKVPTKSGPAVGSAKGNPIKGGGVTQATRGKFK